MYVGMCNGHVLCERVCVLMHAQGVYVCSLCEACGVYVCSLCEACGVYVCSLCEAYGVYVCRLCEACGVYVCRPCEACAGVCVVCRSMCKGSIKSMYTWTASVMWFGQPTHRHVMSSIS